MVISAKSVSPFLILATAPTEDPEEVKFFFVHFGEYRPRPLTSLA